MFVPPPYTAQMSLAVSIQKPCLLDGLGLPAPLIYFLHMNTHSKHADSVQNGMFGCSHPSQTQQEVQTITASSSLGMRVLCCACKTAVLCHVLTQGCMYRHLSRWQRARVRACLRVLFLPSSRWAVRVPASVGLPSPSCPLRLLCCLPC